jgi:hypothetical protein
MGTLMNQLSQSASVIAFDYVFRVCALLFLGAIPLLLLVRRGAAPVVQAMPQPMAEAA